MSCRLAAVDFFCGAGGLTKGLTTAGIQVRLGVDVDSTCELTYKSNNPDSRFICADLRRLPLDAVIDAVADVPRNQLLLAGCAPCQPFSSQRRRPTRGETGTLLSAFGAFVAQIRPGFVLSENVPGMDRVPGFSTLRRFEKMLAECGYACAKGVLDAKHYGVPQSRRRLVLVAALVGQPLLPWRDQLQPCRTVWEAIGHFPPLRAGERSLDVPNHVAAGLSELNLRRLMATPADGGGRSSWPDDLTLRCHSNGYSGHPDVYGRMWWDRPAPTLTCRCHGISNGRYGHPVQHRAISLREAAALQGFPDDYVFYGESMSGIAGHIGNAVPVPLAEALGRSILAVAATRGDGQMPPTD